MGLHQMQGKTIQGDLMSRRGYMNRYQCNACNEFFRGLNEDECPLCNSKNISIVATGVGD
jgi:rubrerythrin